MEILSLALQLAGLTQPIIKVKLFPPKDSYKILVNTLDLNGIWLF